VGLCVFVCVCVCVGVFVWVCVCAPVSVCVRAHLTQQLNRYESTGFVCRNELVYNSSEWHLIQILEADGKCFVFRASHARLTHAWFLCSPYTSVSTSCELRLDLKALRFSAHILSKCIENSFLKWFLEINSHVQ